MRTAPDEAEFAQWLLRVGNGELAPEVEIPRECIVDGDLAVAVFGVNIGGGEVDRFRSTVILAARNADCDAINASVNERIRGEVVEYMSVESTPWTPWTMKATTRCSQSSS